MLFFVRIGYLIIGIVCGAALWALLGVAGLTITRTLQTPRVMVDESVREHIVVSNQFPWQRGIVEILDDTTFMRQITGFVVTLGAKQQRQRMWRSTAPIRGVDRDATTAGHACSCNRQRRGVRSATGGAPNCSTCADNHVYP
ncbi:MAG: hypothetical protein LW717_05625 [Chloroflexaceae bacterium]|nr:hypothetical protein [Chloroflexaceae bacterium]